MTAQEYLNDKFEYDETSGILFMKNATQSWRNGMPVGNVEKKTGYMRTILFKPHHNERYGLPQRATVHRIIWTMLYGDIPDGYQIDHINHDRADNRLVNLRCISAQENQRNRKLDVRNKSGHNGIRLRESGSYEVATKHYGKTVHIGTYHSIEEAVAARDAYYKATNFHENHGNI